MLPFLSSITITRYLLLDTNYVACNKVDTTNRCEALKEVMSLDYVKHNIKMLVLQCSECQKTYAKKFLCL